MKKESLDTFNRFLELKKVVIKELSGIMSEDEMAIVLFTLTGRPELVKSIKTKKVENISECKEGVNKAKDEDYSVGVFRSLDYLNKTKKIDNNKLRVSWNTGVVYSSSLLIYESDRLEAFTNYVENAAKDMMKVNVESCGKLFFLIVIDDVLTVFYVEDVKSSETLKKGWKAWDKINKGNYGEITLHDIEILLYDNKYEESVWENDGDK